jgi:hypothetical protein
MKPHTCALCALLIGCDVQPGSTGTPPLHPSRQEVLARALARADDDGDGRVQRTEFLHYSDDRDSFARYDRDGDDALDLEELDLAIDDADPTTGMLMGPTPRGAPGQQGGSEGRRGGPGGHKPGPRPGAVPPPFPEPKRKP